MTVNINPAGNGTAISIDNVIKVVSTTLGFTYTQMTPATVWVINHNLGRYPSITIVDTGGNVVYGDYKYIDTNNMTATFSATFSGSAYLN